MEIAFIGHGNVGGALAIGLANAGHRVTICTDDPASPCGARCWATWWWTPRTPPGGPGITDALGTAQSGTAMIQRCLPDGRVVKCFSVYGFEKLGNPSSPAPG